jgi:hypothetical protein
MRRPTRSPFHHSDLGGPFVAFARGFHECNEEVRREADSHHPRFTPIRHRRWSALLLLVNALGHRRWRMRYFDFVVPGKRPVRRSSKSAGARRWSP